MWHTFFGKGVQSLTFDRGLAPNAPNTAIYTLD